MKKQFDYVVFGAGIFGLYATKLLAEKGFNVALIEIDPTPLERASYINQARVHNGYHYPRSVSTAAKSSNYYQRFSQEFEFAVNSQFKKIYTISATDSLTNAEQFLKFCNFVGVPAQEINSEFYFNKGSVDASYETIEYSYDAQIIKKWFLEKLKGFNKVDFFFNTQLKQVVNEGTTYLLQFNNNLTIRSPKILNATYAGLNQIIQLFNFELFNIKYEICEVILTEVNEKLKNVGITVMDGPFFSVMPFGLSGVHSLTSVSHTPHATSYDKLPTFDCQKRAISCSSETLQNCNSCQFKPNTAWIQMLQLSKKYLIPEIEIKYKNSLFAVKTILNTAELDDSRPTVFKMFSNEPTFISVLSGKFNTIYDLEDLLT